jgi:hypothetical protein
MPVNPHTTAGTIRLADQPTPPAGHARSSFPLGRVAALAVAVILAGAACGEDTTDRQAAVASAGAEVMPFDLEATTHRFTKTPDGGVQSVTADDPSDPTQIRLIREHLQMERDSFSRGDYNDPARVHGMDMPGVAELSDGYEQVDVSYSELPAGAELTYSSTEPQLVAAIHAWFDRQVADHGDDAEAG